MSNGKKMMDMGRANSSNMVGKSVSWEAPEFVQFERSVWWYVILIAVGLVLMIMIYFMDQNYLGMGVVALAVIVMIIMAKQKPRIQKYSISSDMISIGDKNTPIAEFKSFYVTYVNGIANLHIERAKKLSSPVSMFITNNNEQTVLDFIKKILPENVKINSTAGDMFSNWFRF